MKKKWTALLIAMLALTVFAVGCGSKGDGQAANKIVVGTDASFPPFESLTPDGKPEGFDIDLINAIAKSQKLDIEVKHVGWDPMMAGLENDSIKAGIAGITMNDDRKKQFDFTDPYFTAKQSILIKNSVTNVNTIADLKGKKIGVQSGTTGQTVVEDKFGKGYTGLKGFDDIASAIDDMKNGRIDAVVADNAVIKKFKEQLHLDDVKIVEDKTINQEQYGIAVKKGNKELLDKLNQGLKAVKADGTYDKIYAKYFK
ncbi:basic amino acid ABC transporter substrate-binding protein [Aneurinibacillus uraniidurans]|uniref:basic amino acid ABC transporter substrate-binding protein n=1 Tax=Aneurinibacillus uraniidurans TaxID=2966586 RepID=UPI00234AFCB8|nr:basic amino acid ABC transporter substrate-binding protein [Aneurinibacillus sp. B1]WCN39004.1 basic amino acid ABC transporter substrate-binding protein [Aneurinibacillus sp. B1]